MGFSTADQMNPTPMIKGGPAAYQPDQMNPEMDPNQPMLMGGPAAYQPDQMNPGTSSPGMGGKGGVAGDPAMGAQQMNIPQVPTMNPPQTGLPGLPVPVAPMTPLGPGLGNPGGPGVQPQQRIAPPAPMPPVATPFRPNQQSRPNPFMSQNRMAPQMPQPGRANMPLRGPMLMNRGGAGRGGMLR